MKKPEEGNLVFVFDRPHKIGSICSQGCTQCGAKEKGVQTIGSNGEILPFVPFLILGEATLDDWKRQDMGKTRSPYGEFKYFYFVSTD